MKNVKLILAFILILACFIAAMWIWCETDCATLCAGSRRIDISWEDTEQLRELLQIRTIHFDGAACGFREDDAVKIGCLTYCFARDDCNTIYIKELNLYYSITNRTKLDELLAKYY